MRGSNLGLDDWDSHAKKSNTEALDGTPSDEGCEVTSEDLDEGAEEVDESADADTLLATNDVPEPSCDERSKCCSQLQAGHGYAGNGRIDRSEGAVSSSVLVVKPSNEDRID